MSKPNIWHYLTFFFIAVMYLLALGNITLQYSGDSGSYLNVANNFSSPAILDRPIGYPFILWVTQTICGDYWSQALVILQILAMATSGVLCFNIIKLFTFGNFIAFLSAVFAVCMPALISHSQFLLTESFHSFFMTLTWYLTVLFLTQSYEPKSKFRLVLCIGLLSGICALIKPIWLMGIVPLTIACFCVLKYRKEKYISYLLLLGLAHLIVVYSWGLFVNAKYQTLSISRVGTVNFNLTAIRAGLTKYGEGTSLYNYLDSTGQLEQALLLKWENSSDGFDSIKTHLPWEVRTDESFRNNVMKSAWKPYLACSIKRYSAFYKTKESSATLFLNNSFLKRIYQFVYSRMVSLFIVLLPLSLLFAFWKKELRGFQILNFSIILYYYVMLTLFTYYDSSFDRLRTSVDVIMVITSLLPVIYLFKYIGLKAKVVMKRKNASQ
jgi:hypothetical protein